MMTDNQAKNSSSVLWSLFEEWLVAADVIMDLEMTDPVLVDFWRLQILVYRDKMAERQKMGISRTEFQPDHFWGLP